MRGLLIKEENIYEDFDGDHIDSDYSSCTCLSLIGHCSNTTGRGRKILIYSCGWADDCYMAWAHSSPTHWIHDSVNSQDGT